MGIPWMPFGDDPMLGKRVTFWTLFASLAIAMVAVSASRGQVAGAPPSASATSIPESHLMQPEGLVRLLKPGVKEKPVILQVGSRVLFGQAHIPAAEYAGPGSQLSGIQSLESVVSGLPKNKQIVLYCGCCPWNRCPNVGPAFKRLRELGFTNVNVLYLANNFGDDWVNKGYPAVKGK
jgi:thiosulfate/3-mercaptopyruvate sulfurtransferase